MLNGSLKDYLMSYDSKKDYKKDKKYWNNSMLRQRSPAGYEAFLQREKEWKNKGKETEAPASTKKKKDKSDTWNAKPYLDSDEYKANEKLIEDSQSYKSKDLKIGSKGQSNEEWYKDQFKGIDPLGMPKDPKMPNINKVKGYSGKEKWAGPKKSSRFKPSLTKPDRLRAKDLKISTKTPYSGKKKLGPSGSKFKPTSPKKAGFGKFDPGPGRITNKKSKR